ncbi:prepilin-type N-terminal cleavage/methylation domain-containing protein [bacterium]|nr:prepilin-type N-terminal cleavage/methylation domain-containing protein [bacterium]
MKDLNKGYTLIELIVIIIVTGIFGGMVGLYFSRMDNTTQMARAAHQVLSDVRYAQEMAMSANRGVDFQITGNSYSILWTLDGTAVQSTFDGSVVEKDIGDELGAYLSGSSFSFTADGLPDRAITLSVTRNDDAYNIVVIAETGYSYIENVSS